MLILIDELEQKVIGYQTLPKTTDAPHFVADDTLRDFILANPDLVYHLGVVWSDVKMAWTLEPQWQANAEARLAAAIEAEKLRQAREWRDVWLVATDQFMIADWPITGAQKSEVTAFRSELRAWPDDNTFPTTSPTAPIWVAEAHTALSATYAG